MVQVSSEPGPGSVVPGPEAPQPDGVSGVPGTGQQDGRVPAELGAETKVDERVVETGRLGEEPGEDAGQVGDLEAPGGPHGHHRVGGPGQDEGHADHYGHLGKQDLEQEAN